LTLSVVLRLVLLGVWTARPLVCSGGTAMVQKLGLRCFPQEALSSIFGQPESVSDFCVSNIGYGKHVDFGTRGLLERRSSQQFASYVVSEMLTTHLGHFGDAKIFREFLKAVAVVEFPVTKGKL
jgi:hypothetical protein